MADSTLNSLTAKTPGAAALLYGAVSPYTTGLDRKVAMTAAGAALIEAANAAAQRTALGVATVSYPKTLFVSATLGNNGTAVIGNPTLPYATAQAAFDAWAALGAAGHMHIMDGSVGGITLSTDMAYVLHVTGNGPKLCNLGGVTANGAAGATGAEDGVGGNGSAGHTMWFTSDYSVNFGEIIGNGGGGGNGGTPTTVDTNGGVGGSASPARLFNVLCQRVNLFGGIGGNGGNYSGGDYGGNGGANAAATLIGVMAQGSPGAIGIAPGGGGSGSFNGSDGGTPEAVYVIGCQVTNNLGVGASTGHVLNSVGDSVSVTGGAGDTGNVSLGIASITWPLT